MTGRGLEQGVRRGDWEGGETSQLLAPLQEVEPELEQGSDVEAPVVV